MLKKRDIALCVILSIITCGIYSIYWFIVLTDDIGEASGDHSISGGVAFLLTLITCGIYGIYWAYRMGQNITVAKRNRGIETLGTDMAVVYLLLQVFNYMVPCLGLVNFCLMQNELNKMD